jgi:DNA primase
MESLPPEEAARILNARSVGEGRWLANCPVHDDATPSLSIARGNRVALLMRCFACGASFEDLLRAIEARRAGVR